MTRQNINKINQLIKTAPRGVVLTAQWLKDLEVSHKLAWWYVRSGWLDRIADGAYKLGEDEITWASALQALQQQLQLPIHLGGKTALQLLGKSHYASREILELQLFAPSGTKLPRWLNAECFKSKFNLYATSLFADVKTSDVSLLTQEFHGLICSQKTAPF